MKRKGPKTGDFKNKRVKKEVETIEEDVGGLPSETRDYLKQLNNCARNGKIGNDDDQKEELSILSNRVAEEITGHVLAACDDPPVSRLLEFLLKNVGDTWSSLCTALSDPSAGLTTRRHWGQCGPASRVLEALIMVAGRLRQADSKKAGKALKTISKFLFNNFDLENGALENKYNHLVRACLVSARSVYPEICADFCKRFLDWPQIYDHCKTPTVAALLQEIIVTSEVISSELCHSIVDKIREQVFTEDKNFDATTSCKPIIMLLECLIEHGSSETRNAIFNQYLKGRLMGMCLGGDSKFTSSNFLVVKLFQSIEKGDEDIFRAIFSELTEDGGLKKLLDAGKYGVISSLSKACLERGQLQGEFAKAFREALGFPPNSDFIKQALYMNTDRSHVHGSEILQNQLKFKKPVKTVECLLCLPSSSLVELALEPKGSWIFDAFMTSPSVGEKSREKLANLLCGSYLELAKAKFGSRVFDAVWNVSSEKMKLKIMDELDSTIKGSLFGAKVARRIMFDEYKKDPQAWRQKVAAKPSKK